MPSYDFECEGCRFVSRKYMSISQYKEFSVNSNICDKCGAEGSLKRIVNNVLSETEKTRDQILDEAKEYAVKTVKKIMNRDERTIRDIYGDTPNPHKTKPGAE